MNCLANFFAGVFLCNCIPHLVAGLQGTPFPSPFAKPPGKGDSAPWVNFLWGFFNAAVGVWLLSVRPLIVGLNLPSLCFVVGALLIGLHLSYHFGKVRRQKPNP